MIKTSSLKIGYEYMFRLVLVPLARIGGATKQNQNVLSVSVYFVFVTILPPLKSQCLLLTSAMAANFLDVRQVCLLACANLSPVGSTGMDRIVFFLYYYYGMGVAVRSRSRCLLWRGSVQDNDRRY